MIASVSRVGNPTRAPAMARAIGDNAWDRAGSRAVHGGPPRAILSHERRAGECGSAAFAVKTHHGPREDRHGRCGPAQPAVLRPAQDAMLTG